METKRKNIVSLSDDIRQIVLDAYGEKLEMIRLSEDHHNPLLHNDNKPILNLTQDEFVGIFDLNSNHYFLSPDQVFRLGEYCGLPLPNLIALVLKAEWESFFSEQAGYTMGAELHLGSILCDQQLVEMYISEFRPNRGIILELIEQNSSYLESAKRNDHAEFIISDLLKEHKFLLENDQIDQLYPEKGISEKTLLKKSPKVDREKYFRLKELWKLKSTELDDLLIFLERKKRINLGIENKYFKNFGKIEVEKSRYEYKAKKYKIIFDTMRERPELSYRELVKLAEERLSEANKEYNEIKNKIARSHNCIEDLGSAGLSSQATTEFKNSYMQACKKILRKLFFLLHSDTCPKYSELSRYKKTEINELWLKLMKSTKEELYSFSPSMLLYDLPDFEQLVAIYKRACEILEIRPDDFEFGNRLDFMIRKGSSINEIIEFLSDEIETLELHLAHLELVQNEYTSEDKSQYYRDALANINDHTARLESEISNLKKQIDQLKKKISNSLIENMKVL